MTTEPRSSASLVRTQREAQREQGGWAMLKKLISGVVMVAGVIAMAMPAHALPVVRHADFGSNGSVRVAYVNHRWMGRANILGLSNGTYEVYMNSWLDENHD